MANSKSGWLLYVMVHVPLVWKFKVGITSQRIGAKKRAAAIDRAVLGFPVPIMVLIVPGAYHVEQALHAMMWRFRTDFYKGDGHSEWFNLAPLFVAVPIMLTVWGLYIAAFDAALGTDVLPLVAKAFFYTVFP